MIILQFKLNTTQCGVPQIDRLTARFYSGAMTKSKDTSSFDEELKRLEGRLDELVLICNQLKEENRSLKQRQDTLSAERATMLQKNEQVRSRVEAMIGRLKAMETGS